MSQTVSTRTVDGGIVEMKRKPGFLSPKELFEKKTELTDLCAKHRGTPFLVEKHYLKRTRFGGPRAACTFTEATEYTFGVVGNCLKKNRDVLPSIFSIPAQRIARWHTELYYVPAYIESDVHLFAGMKNATFYRVFIGSDNLAEFLAELSLDRINGGDEALLRFWEVAQTLNVDLSANESIYPSLVTARTKALSEYVQAKIDKACLHEMEKEGALIFGKLYDPFPLQPLLRLGLSEVEIAERARVLALERLGL